MTLPASYPISMAQVNTELGRSASAAINLNDSAVRTLFGKPGNPISLSDGLGKSNATHSLYSVTFAAGWLGAYTTGFSLSNPAAGSISPGYLFGKQIYGINEGSGVSAVAVVGTAPQNLWYSFKINGKTYYSANLTYGYTSTYNYTSWSWSMFPDYQIAMFPSMDLADNTNYPITFT